MDSSWKLLVVVVIVLFFCVCLGELGAGPPALQMRRHDTDWPSSVRARGLPSYGTIKTQTPHLAAGESPVGGWPDTASIDGNITTIATQVVFDKQAIGLLRGNATRFIDDWFTMHDEGGAQYVITHSSRRCTPTDDYDYSPSIHDHTRPPVKDEPSWAESVARFFSSGEDDDLQQKERFVLSVNNHSSSLCIFDTIVGSTVSKNIGTHGVDMPTAHKQIFASFFVRVVLGAALSFFDPTTSMQTHKGAFERYVVSSLQDWEIVFDTTTHKDAYDVKVLSPERNQSARASMHAFATHILDRMTSAGA